MLVTGAWRRRRTTPTPCGSSPGAGVWIVVDDQVPQSSQVSMSRTRAQTASREAPECAEASMTWWLIGPSQHAGVVRRIGHADDLQHPPVEVEDRQRPRAQRGRQHEAAGALDVVRAARDARGTQQAAVEGVDADAAAVAAGDVRAPGA